MEKAQVKKQLLKKPSNSTVRLNKYLASMGFTSRRKVLDLLEASIVTVNGVRVKEIGIRINPSKDKVLVNGKPIKSPELLYFMVNKPKGVVSTVSDEHGRKTVVDLVNLDTKIYPVGRLDQDSKGLILLTNDGEFANKLTHPKFHIPKTYILLISGNVKALFLDKLRSGVLLKDGLTEPSEVEIIEENHNRTILQITLYQGKNRQIRRMCAALKINLLELKRVAIGVIKLGDLPSGEFRPLKTPEIDYLMNYSD